MNETKVHRPEIEHATAKIELQGFRHTFAVEWGEYTGIMEESATRCGGVALDPGISFVWDEDKEPPDVDDVEGAVMELLYSNTWQSYW